MPNLERFDEDFFGIPESQVNLIDPQERLLLELTYEAIVDAGMNYYPVIYENLFLTKLVSY